MGLAIGVYDSGRSSHELMVLLLHQRPPVLRKQVAEHEIDLQSCGA